MLIDHKGLTLGVFLDTGTANESLLEFSLSYVIHGLKQLRNSGGVASEFSEF